MPQDSSFDIISEINVQEMDNASIQGDSLRVSGNKKDDLQAVIQYLRANPPEIPLQFTNFR